jgi:hypothetical protein
MRRLRSALSLLRRKVMAVLRVGVVAVRFIVHPVDFLRLYQRESEIANSALDVAMLTLEDEFLSRVQHLEARIDELESSRRAPETTG